MANPKNFFDYICIGAGSGGIASANKAAQQGAKVALIEPKALGGTCVNLGCVPKKIMWYAAQLQESIQAFAPDYGFDVKLHGLDWQKLKQSRQAYIERIHGFYDTLLMKHQITHVQGYAKFVDKQTIVVDGQFYSAPHITVAVGAAPTRPSIEGQALGLDSNGFFALEQQPKRVAVVGAGYIAVELASLLLGLGSETHLIMRKGYPLRQFDAMLGQTMVQQFAKQGMHLHPNVQCEQVIKEKDNSLTLALSDQSRIHVDCVIWAIGRQPATDSLHLSEVGVKLNAEGKVEADAYHNTSVDGIYAVGDIVAGSAELTPVAVKSGRQLAMRLFGRQTHSPIEQKWVPTVVFSHPPAGSVGLSQAAAEESYGVDQVKVYTSQFTSMLSGVTTHRQQTYLKLVCVGAEQRVVGLHGLGTGMDEILQGFAVAVKLGATKADFDSTLAIHPTSAEEFVLMT